MRDWIERHPYGVLAIVIVILLLAFIAGYILSVGQAGGAPAPKTTREFINQPLSKYERKFLDLDRGAIEQAYLDQIKHLFEIWMRDDTGQPARAVTGAKQARKAFEQTMDAIDQREQNWKQQQEQQR